MPEFSSFDGTDLAYQQEGLGRPAVLLHGLSVNTDLNWKTPGIWGALVDAGHRVIGFDARGHGRSGKPHEPAAYEDGAMVKDVAALLDALSLDQIDLVGYSMGASTALQFAGRDRRVRRLVLGGIGGDPHAWGTPDDTRAATARRWLAGLEAADPDTIEDPLARGRARSSRRAATTSPPWPPCCAPIAGISPAKWPQPPYPRRRWSSAAIGTPLPARWRPPFRTRRHW